MYTLISISAALITSMFLLCGAGPALSASVTVGTEVTIYTGVLGVNDGAVACNTQSGEYLAVWEDDGTLSLGLWDIRAQLLSSDGTTKGGVVDIELSQGVQPPSYRWALDVAHSSKQDKYCVVYAEDFQTFVEILAHDGTIEYSGSMPYSPGYDHYGPVVAYNSNDDEFLVVWEQYVVGSGSDIESMRITWSSGGYILTGTKVNLATGWNTSGDGKDRSTPAVAYNTDRNEYLIVYTYGDYVSSQADIYGKIVPADLSGALSKSEIKIQDNTDNQKNAAVAAGDDEFLIVWEDRPNNNYSRVHGRRVGGDGTLPGSSFTLGDYANKLCESPKTAYSPGNGYVVVFEYDATSSGATKGNYVVSGTDTPFYSTPFDIGTKALIQDIACQPTGTCLETHVSTSTTEIKGVFLTVASVSSTTTTTPASGNTAPTAAFTVNPAVGDTSTTFVLEPFTSSDAEDPITALSVKVDWETDGTWDDTLAADVDVSHQYSADGTYTITIEVEDTGGLTDQATQQVKVIAQASGNTTPSASFSVSPTSGDTSTTFSFDASGCSDAEDAASSLEIMWDFDGDGMWDTTLSTTKTATHQYSSGGTYDVELVVIDTGGLSGTTVQQVVVSGGSASSTTTTVAPGGSNSAPKAVAKVHPPEGPVDIEFEFTFEESNDVEDAAELLEGRWDFESDGTWDTEYSTERFVMHRFDTPDLYTVTLEVKDSGGLTDQDTVELLVTEAGGCALTDLFSDDPDAIAALKSLRDKGLAHTRLGRTVIRIYYRLSPGIVELLDSSPRIKAFTKNCLQLVLQDRE